jgi:hypothetical protein
MRSVLRSRLTFVGLLPFLCCEERPGFHPGYVSFVPTGLDFLPSFTQDCVLGYFLPSLRDWVWLLHDRRCDDSSRVSRFGYSRIGTGFTQDCVLGYFLVQTGSMVYRMYREDG